MTIQNSWNFPVSGRDVQGHVTSSLRLKMAHFLSKICNILDSKKNKIKKKILVKSQLLHFTPISENIRKLQ